MPSPVEAGQELLIDLFDGEALGAPITVKWQQNFVDRQASYYRVDAYNTTTEEPVPFFIAAEFYKSSTASNPNHITKVATVIPGGMSFSFLPPAQQRRSSQRLTNDIRELQAQG